MAWRKVLSYKIQKIIADFCFDTNTKWRFKPNNILFVGWHFIPGQYLS